MVLILLSNNREAAIYQGLEVITERGKAIKKMFNLLGITSTQQMLTK